LIGAFLPISAVTPFSIARRLSEVGQILTDQFLKTILPLASELKAENDLARLRSLYVISSRLTLAIFLPVGGILVVLARPILTLWVGSEYADYAPLVFILVLASLVDTSQWPAGSVLQGIARHRPLAIISVCAAAAELALSIVLLRRFGLIGVALGTMIPTVVVCLGLVMPYAMQVLNVGPNMVLKEVLLPTVLPAVPMVLVLHFFKQVVEPASLLSIMAIATTGSLVYAIIYLTVGASQIERGIFRSFIFNAFRFAGTHFKRS